MLDSLEIEPFAVIIIFKGILSWQRLYGGLFRSAFIILMTTSSSIPAPHTSDNDNFLENFCKQTLTIGYPADNR
jgi:hypothetical protein